MNRRNRMLLVLLLAVGLASAASFTVYRAIKRMPVREVVQHSGGSFVAYTLVRACERLLVDGRIVAVPGAACRGTIEHHFRLGSVSAS